MLQDPANKESGLAMSAQNLYQLVAQILTAAGATPSATLAERLGRQEGAPEFAWVSDWHALGPYPDKAATPAAQSLALLTDGEPAAISGHIDPSILYRPTPQQSVHWHPGVAAGEDGFVNLGSALGKSADMVAYATTFIHSDSDRGARLRVGVDYWFKAWLNGEVIYEVADSHSSPQANAFKTDIHLRKGENILTMKVKAGGAACGFWANISKPETISLTRKNNEKPADLYPSKDPGWDPYQYFYW